MVMSAGLPDLDFVQPGTFRSDESALERNRDIVRESTLEDWLPSVTTDADGDAVEGPLLECSDVAMPDDDAGLGTLAVVGFDAATPGHLGRHRGHHRLADGLRLGGPAGAGDERLERRLGRRLGGRVHRRLRRPVVVGRHHPPLLLRAHRQRRDVRRVRRGRGRRRRPLGDGRGRRRAAPGRRPDVDDRELQLRPHPERGGRRPRGDRSRGPARGERADQVRALVRRPRDRGDLPADRPLLRRRPDRPGVPHAPRGAQDPGLLGVPPPARRLADDRPRPGRRRRRDGPGAPRPRCSTSTTSPTRASSTS